MLIDELFIKARRTVAIKRAQEELNARLASDPEFARRESALPRHACLGDWIVPSIGRRVLELGCGPGRYVAMIGSMGFEVVGVDPAWFETWDMVRRAGNVTLLDGVKAERLPFDDGSFDHVCCLGALLYFDDVGEALAEMRRVLKPGGRMVVRSINKNNLYTRRSGVKLDPASKNLYSLEDMRSLFRDVGFEEARAFQYGYYPGLFPGLYWYFANVHMSSCDGREIERPSAAGHASQQHITFNSDRVTRL